MTLCPTCERSAEEYTYPLSTKHLVVLRAIFVPAGIGVPVNYQQLFDGAAPNPVRQGVSEAKHWGMLRLLDKRGVWALSPYGALWEAGETGAPSWVRTFGNRVVDVAEDEVFSHGVPPARRMSYDEALLMATPHQFA